MFCRSLYFSAACRRFRALPGAVTQSMRPLTAATLRPILDPLQGETAHWRPPNKVDQPRAAQWAASNLPRPPRPISFQLRIHFDVREIAELGGACVFLPLMHATHRPRLAGGAVPQTGRVSIVSARKKTLNEASNQNHGRRRPCDRLDDGLDAGSQCRRLRQRHLSRKLRWIPRPGWSPSPGHCAQCLPFSSGLRSAKSLLTRPVPACNIAPPIIAAAIRNSALGRPLEHVTWL